MEPLGLPSGGELGEVAQQPLTRSADQGKWTFCRLQSGCAVLNVHYVSEVQLLVMGRVLQPGLTRTAGVHIRLMVLLSEVLPRQRKIGRWSTGLF